MRPIATLVAGLLVSGAAAAGDVYVTKDAQGNLIYTDTPLTVPAKKVDIHSDSTNPDTVEQRYSSEMSQYAKDNQAAAKSQAQQAAAQQAAQDTAADQAKRCVEARQTYQTYMNSWRLYDTGANGERVYLTSEQIDKARADAKQAMDQFCSGQ